MIRARCPWSGMECDCEDFPWIRNGLIPQKCEDRLSMEAIPLRAVSANAKARYQKYKEFMAQVKAGKKKLDDMPKEWD